MRNRIGVGPSLLPGRTFRAATRPAQAPIRPFEIVQWPPPKLNESAPAPLPAQIPANEFAMEVESARSWASGCELSQRGFLPKRALSRGSAAAHRPGRREFSRNAAPTPHRARLSRPILPLVAKGSLPKCYPDLQPVCVAPLVCRRWEGAKEKAIIEREPWRVDIRLVTRIQSE